MWDLIVIAARARWEAGARCGTHLAPLCNARHKSGDCPPNCMRLPRFSTLSVCGTLNRTAARRIRGSASVATFSPGGPV